MIPDTADDDDLFQTETSSIIKNPQILSSDYKPEKIPARDDQKKQVASLLRPALDNNGSPVNAIIFGPNGAGKTLTVAHVLDMFVEKATHAGKQYKYVFINCAMQSNSLFKMYQQILDTIEPGLEFKIFGKSAAKIYDKICEKMKEKNLSIIVVFDEIEALKDQDILYTLSRAGESKEIPSHLHFGIIGITNDHDNNIFTNQKIISSFGSTRIHFPPYTNPDVELILNDRLVALHDGTYEKEDFTNDMAQYNAYFRGDARKSIELMAQCAKAAQLSKHNKITDVDIFTAYKNMECDKTIDVILTLNYQQRLLYLAAIRMHKFPQKSTPTSGELYNHYKIVCTENESTDLDQSTLANMVNYLESVGLLEVNRTRPAKSWGNTRSITLTINDDKIVEVLREFKKDTLINNLGRLGSLIPEIPVELIPTVPVAEDKDILIPEIPVESIPIVPVAEDKDMTENSDTQSVPVH